MKLKFTAWQRLSFSIPSSFTLPVCAGWACHRLRRCPADGAVRPGVRRLPAQQGVSPGQHQRQVPRPAGPARLQEAEARLEPPWRLRSNTTTTTPPPKSHTSTSLRSLFTCQRTTQTVRYPLDLFLLGFSSLCLLKYGFSVKKKKKKTRNENVILFLSWTLIYIF